MVQFQPPRLSGRLVMLALDLPDLQGKPCAVIHLDDINYVRRVPGVALGSQVHVVPTDVNSGAPSVQSLQEEIARLQSMLRAQGTRCFDCDGSGRNRNYPLSVIDRQNLLVMVDPLCRTCGGSGVPK